MRELLTPKVNTATEVAVLVKVLPSIEMAADLIEQYAKTERAGATVDRTIEASQPSEEKPLEVDFFCGTAFSVGELTLSYRELESAIRDLANGNRTGSAVQQKLAAEKINKISFQMNALAGTLVRVTISHINRRPR